MLAHHLQVFREDLEMFAWRFALVIVLFWLAGCLIVESTAGYLGELTGFYRCRQQCPFDDAERCTCAAPSEKKEK